MSDINADLQLAAKTNYLPDIHRMLPASPDAEQGVIGSFLLMPKDVGAIIEDRQITAEQFHIPAHKEIFTVLINMLHDGMKIDFIMLTETLRKRKMIDQVGGAAYITGLFTFVPTAANASYYINILLEKYKLRAIIQVGTEYAARAYDEQDDPSGLLDQFESSTLSISREDCAAEDKDTFPSSQLAIESSQRIESMYENRGKITGITTGFVDYDVMTDGLHPAEMVIIAARPSMGKTALAMNIAEHIAIHSRIPVMFYSLEMSRAQLMDRTSMSRAMVNLQAFRRGAARERDFPALTKSLSEIGNAPLFINDRSAIKINYLRTSLRRMVKKHGIQVAFIDYLQLIHGSKNYKGGDRQAEVSEISAGIKDIAKELNIPIVVLAQLNRTPDQRNGALRGKPRLSDLRESGSIEQDADTVGLLTREEVYCEDEESKREAEGKAELIIAKQRNGPTGTVHLTFLKEFTRFETRATEQEEARLSI